jgi:hypothetical protein
MGKAVFLVSEMYLIAAKDETRDNDSAYYCSFLRRSSKTENKSKWSTDLNRILGIYIYAYLILLRLVVSISVRYILFNCLDVILSEKSDIRASIFLSLINGK